MAVTQIRIRSNGLRTELPGSSSSDWVPYVIGGDITCYDENQEVVYGPETLRLDIGVSSSHYKFIAQVGREGWTNNSSINAPCVMTQVRPNNSSNYWGIVIPELESWHGTTATRPGSNYSVAGGHTSITGWKTTEYQSPVVLGETQATLHERRDIYFWERHATGFAIDSELSVRDATAWTGYFNGSYAGDPSAGNRSRVNSFGNKFLPWFDARTREGAYPFEVWIYDDDYTDFTHALTPPPLEPESPEGGFSPAPFQGYGSIDDWAQSLSIKLEEKKRRDGWWQDYEDVKMSLRAFAPPPTQQGMMQEAAREANIARLSDPTVSQKVEEVHQFFSNYVNRATLGQYGTPHDYDWLFGQNDRVIHTFAEDTVFEYDLTLGNAVTGGLFVIGAAGIYVATRGRAPVPRFPTNRFDVQKEMIKTAGKGTVVWGALEYHDDVIGWVQYGVEALGIDVSGPAGIVWEVAEIQARRGTEGVEEFLDEGATKARDEIYGGVQGDYRSVQMMRYWKEAMDKVYEGKSALQDYMLMTATPAALISRWRKKYGQLGSKGSYVSPEPYGDSEEGNGLLR